MLPVLLEDRLILVLDFRFFFGQQAALRLLQFNAAGF